MKKIILTTLIALSVFVAKAQKLDKPYIDKIKNDTVLNTKDETLFNWMKKLSVSSNVVKLHDHSPKGYSITLTVLEVGGYITVTSDTKSYLKLDDGSVIELTPNTDTYIVSELTSIKYGTHTTNINYVLSDEQFKKLTSHKISFIQIKTSQGNIDFDIKDSKSDIIEKQLSLVSSI